MPMQHDEPQAQMTDTEIQLVAAHGGPTIRLELVCNECFGLTYPEARRAAALNRLPVPTFRLRDSAKAPVMIRAKELAAHIDAVADRAAAVWERSNT